MKVKTDQGDMRDLHVYEDHKFNIVFHPCSLNFVPDARVVFKEVAQVIKPGGGEFRQKLSVLVNGLSKMDSLFFIASKPGPRARTQNQVPGIIWLKSFPHGSDFGVAIDQMSNGKGRWRLTW